ncbi:CRISPR-associated protein Csx19 [Planktothrix agardhii 1811]|jgi:CRISPR-associated protein (TIGR03984 family)|uniref:type III-D CRISPR-associated protein Csx19 n=1 Tax=Planktothrix agardhii TaxID=1160 RepID=UPI001F26910A|nr:CRISPR-associated protein Csx19 [Planktothrix agardhii]MCF3583351.1 CRISPR-associated protein Csx19 [Planktothrix agardhii 1811]
MSEEKVFKNDDELHSWLESQAPSVSTQTPYLLAHADDGVIWGRFDKGKLTIANEVFTESSFPTLRLCTLQQCRVFGQQGEVLLWKYGKNWKWRFLDNFLDNTEKDKIIIEPQILWGTHGERRGNFTLLWDGSQGLKHAVPFGIVTVGDRQLDQRVRLIVHHYINYNEEGVAYINRSRLVDLTTQEIKSGKNYDC